MNITDIKNLILKLYKNKGRVWWKKILMRDYPDAYQIILADPRFAAHNFKFTLDTMCNWILTDRYDFPICKNPKCSKKIMKNIHIFGEYLDHCCVKCSQQDPNIRSKIEATNICKYGATCPLQGSDIKERIRQKCYQKFGVYTPFDSIDIQEKARQTLFTKYNVMHPLQNAEIHQRQKQTTFEHFGVEYSWQADEVKEKCKRSCYEKFGVENASQSTEIKVKKVKTCRKNFGVDYPIQADTIKQKIQQTNISRYGYINPMSSSSIAKKSKSKYTYHEINFDSLPELAFFIWLQDNNKNFQYKPAISFNYTYKNINHIYQPDFIVDDAIIEIKGDYFFDSTGKMICPYRNADWSEMQYEDACNLYEAKHQCMIDNNVRILRSDEYSIYIKYVNEKYGSKYLAAHKNISKES